jgi:hypothetical protein
VNNDNKLREALAMAVRQNEHDMLMTGEELRTCRAALSADAAPVALTDEQIDGLFEHQRDPVQVGKKPYVCLDREGFREIARCIEAMSAPSSPGAAEAGEADRDVAIRMWHKHCRPFMSHMEFGPASVVIDAMLEFASLTHPKAEAEARPVGEAPRKNPLADYVHDLEDTLQQIASAVGLDRIDADALIAAVKATSRQPLPAAPREVAGEQKP